MRVNAIVCRGLVMKEGSNQARGNDSGTELHPLWRTVIPHRSSIPRFYDSSVMELMNEKCHYEPTLPKRTRKDDVNRGTLDSSNLHYRSGQQPNNCNDEGCQCGEEN